MKRYRRIDVADEAVINELNRMEQIYKRFCRDWGCWLLQRSLPVEGST